MATSPVDEYAYAAADDDAAAVGYEAYASADAEGYGVEGYDGAGAEWDAEAYAGYTYDPASGEWVYAEDGAEGSYFALDEAAPTSPFGDEAYWQQYGEDAVYEAPLDPEAPARPEDWAPAYYGDAELTAPPLDGPDTGGDATADAGGVTPQTVESAPPASSVSAGNDASPSTSAPPSSSQSRSRRKKPKTKQERVQMRQAQLEKDEAEKRDEADADAGSSPGKTSPGKATGSKAPRPAEPRTVTFLDRERAKVRLRLRKLRAIRRKRMPPQVRILTATRTHLSPLEIYFGGSVEAALSDLFWAAIKGDLRRARFLVEVEQVSVTDATFDPWHMEQTPLHWAAKGGDAPVIDYLLAAGANPRSLDENGSLPLHLACWAGHVDATLALLRATDTKDLYVQDYDAALAPLDWAQLRGHTALVKAIERYEDSKWLPKFVDDLVRGIIRYKIKLYKEPPKSPKSPTRGIQFRRAGPGGAAEPSNQAQNQALDDAAAKSTDTSKVAGKEPGTSNDTKASPESTNPT